MPANGQRDQQLQECMHGRCRHIPCCPGHIRSSLDVPPEANRIVYGNQSLTAPFVLHAHIAPHAAAKPAQDHHGEPGAAWCLASSPARTAGALIAATPHTSPPISCRHKQETQRKCLSQPLRLTMAAQLIYHEKIRHSMICASSPCSKPPPPIWSHSQAPLFNPPLNHPI